MIETLRSLKNGKASDFIAVLPSSLCFRSLLDRTGWPLLRLKVEEGKPEEAPQRKCLFKSHKTGDFSLEFSIDRVILGALLLHSRKPGLSCSFSQEGTQSSWGLSCYTAGSQASPAPSLRRAHSHPGGSPATQQEARPLLRLLSGGHTFECRYFAEWQRGKESTCQAGDTGSITGWRRSPGEGNGKPLQYSCRGQRSLVGYSPYNHKESDMI